MYHFRTISPGNGRYLKQQTKVYFFELKNEKTILNFKHKIMYTRDRIFRVENRKISRKKLHRCYGKIQEIFWTRSGKISYNLIKIRICESDI